MWQDRFLAREGRVRTGVRAVRRGIPVVAGRCRRALTRHELVVGVTGSAGKGTVTRLVADILSTRGKTYCGAGTNTTDGIARTFRRAPSGCRYWAQEMSGHRPGEIARSAAMVRPDIGVVTTVQNDHFREYSSLEALVAEKSELIASLPPDGTAVLNADDPNVMGMARLCRGKVITFGHDARADIRILHVEGRLPRTMAVTLGHGNEQERIVTRYPGKRWAMHFAAAAAVGRAASISLQDCAIALHGAKPDLHKDSVHLLAEGTTMVLDCFKASFWTVPSSLEQVASADVSRRTVVIGTLHDYRGSPRSRYSEATRAALDVADRVCMFGPHAYRMQRMLADHPGRLFLFESIADLHGFLRDSALPGELIYVKSSSADHLERLLYLRRGPISCMRDRCGVSMRNCDTCKHLYGRRLDQAEIAVLA